jgi:hypothetical protein
MLIIHVNPKRANLYTYTVVRRIGRRNNPIPTIDGVENFKSILGVSYCVERFDICHIFINIVFTSYSEPKLPPIPTQTFQAFRGKPSTDSDANSSFAGSSISGGT